MLTHQNGVSVGRSSSKRIREIEKSEETVNFGMIASSITPFDDIRCVINLFTIFSQTYHLEPSAVTTDCPVF